MLVVLEYYNNDCYNDVLVADNDNDNVDDDNDDDVDDKACHKMYSLVLKSNNNNNKYIKKKNLYEYGLIVLFYLK